MNARRSRIQRKAARVEKTDLERELDSGLGTLKRARDEAREKANAEYQKTVSDAATARSKARAQAESDYEDGRGKLLKRLAREESVAAA